MSEARKEEEEVSLSSASSFPDLRKHRQGMAAAGAQTAWQRRANCCFVQEDARSAPRFSSYPSSSSSKAESDIAPENIKPDCMPYNRGPELAPNTKWWLNLEPNCGPQEELLTNS
ncbi:uncharacterized protein LOC108866348 [Pyrus x bretschneideri]|uniref:uncharacterized protein LOC108866348 n=1 Tax=Pyrus x bretschneideri TaxID=225117 RepID=UPI00202FCFE1|nr:uncharacterized protein LOC108866348 [Pyrus x bretschneideri]